MRQGTIHHKRTFILLLTGWTLMLGGLVIFQFKHCKDEIADHAIKIALDNFNKDKAFRLWAASHGGVYVPVTEQTPPNELLSQLEERDITTPSGKKLTLMNPAYMVRQLNEYYSKESGIIGHITSLKLLRPENKPDEWEKRALESFQEGVELATEFSDVNNRPHFRLMKPLLASQECLKCHSHQGYKAGDVRGGVSVSVPLESIIGEAESDRKQNTASFLIIWLVGSVGIVLGYKNIQKQILKKEIAEGLLLEEKTKLEFINNNVPSAIFTVDIDRKITSWNRKAFDITGYTDSDVIGQECSFIFSNSDNKNCVLCTGEVKSCFLNEYALITKQGNKVIISKKVDFLKDQSGEIMGCIESFEDITSQKEDEIELRNARYKAEESDRMKSAFLANMSHEIRTPMNGIIGFTDLLKSDELSSEKRKEFIQVIHKSGQHLLDLINDIIDISKIEAGMVNLSKSVFSINLLMNELNQFFNSFIIQKKKDLLLEVRCGLPDGTDRIFCDEMRLKQVLNNLLSNAVKFTASGTVHFGYDYIHEQEGETEKLRFFVNDTGIGIPETEQENVFKRFRQVENHLEKKYGGTGLGLYICKSVVEMLDGKIWFQSKENIGSTFYFEIPYASKYEISIEQTNKAMKEEYMPNLNGKTILIVEDNDYNYMYIRELLNIFEPTLIHADNGNDAVGIFRENKNIDLVLLDIQLPGLNGYEVAKEMVILNPTIPIIATTAYALEGEREKCLECGCSDYISKPIERHLLLEKIGRFLIG